MNKTLAIIVTYNRVDLLKECIDALLKQSYKEFDILLVDNASTDHTEQVCKKYCVKHDNIIYQNTGANLGGAGGFHYGLKYGVLHGYDYFWIMDDDTVAYENALEKLFEADSTLNGEYGFLSSEALWLDGSLCKMNMPGMESYSHYQDYCMVQKGLVKIARATFVSFFVKRNVIEEIGLPIKEFFIWCDDIEYTNRICKKYNAYLVCNSKVLHKMQSNVGSDISEDDINRVPRYFYEYRNWSYIARQNGMLWRFYQIYRFWNIMIQIAKSKSKNKGLRFWIVIKGYWCGVWFRPKAEYIKYKSV